MTSLFAPEQQAVTFFIPFIADSLNALLGNPKGHLIYRNQKKKMIEAMVFSGIKQKVQPFYNPVTLTYTPHVARNKTGHVPKAFDTINFAPTYKSIEDRLVNFGILKDDTRDFVQASICNAPIVHPFGHTEIGIQVTIAEC